MRRFWKAPRIATHEGLKAVQMFEAIARGEIKALWVIGTNPAVSLPDADAVRAALKKLELFVVSENVRSNDTVNAGAHVLLPAQAWGEKSGTVTNSERRISRQRAFLTPPGEARPDWWIVSEVAKRLGFGAAFDFKSAADVFREHAALSAFENDGGRDFDIGALTVAVGRGVRCHGAGAVAGARGRAAPQAALLRRRRVFHQRPQGAASSRRKSRRCAARPAPARPLRLNTGRIRDQWHTMTRTRHQPAARPASAGAVRRDSSRRCQQIRRRRRRLCPHHHRLRPVHPEGRRQRAAAARHAVRADPLERGERVAARVGALVAPFTDPFSGQPENKATPASIAPYEYVFRGFALSRKQLELPPSLCGRASPSPAATAICSPTMPICRAGRPGSRSSPASDLAEYRDFGGGVYRAASFAGDRIETCLFVGPAHDAGDWEVVKSLFAADALTDEQRRMLLSGKSTRRARPATGPIVCACFGVGRGTICDAIAAGARTAAEIGAKLKAGTNCGSCIPELKRLIATTDRAGEAGQARERGWVGDTSRAPDAAQPK